MPNKREPWLGEAELEAWRENERDAIREGVRARLTECALQVDELLADQQSSPDTAQSYGGSILRANSLQDTELTPNGSLLDREKPVNFGASKSGSALSSLVFSKQIAMAQTSILSCSPRNTLITDRTAKSLLEKVLPKGYTFLPWDKLDDTDKLMLASGPLLNKAAELGYECKPFTLILNKKLSERLGEGDKTAPEYIRDQMVRLVRKELGTNAWFMYAIEKAPALLCDANSRHRWHLHGLIIGPAGFSAQRIAPIRRALRSLKGEAKSDLMFSEPKEGFQSMLRWSVYCAKNEMSVHQEPGLGQYYELLPGKATFIHRQLLRQTREHYETDILPYARRLAGDRC